MKNRLVATLSAFLLLAGGGCAGLLDGEEDGRGGGGGGGGGGSGGGGALDADACRRLDVVISVDGSGSMDEEMRAMSDEVFGGPSGFARALLDISGGLEDYRVATMDACPDPANFHDRGESRSCNFASGKPWIEADRTRSAGDVMAEFECVGEIDRYNHNCSGDNDDERPVQTIITALNRPFINGPNAGFLRGDALLVVVAITDEDEQPIPDASAAELYEQLVDIKGENNLVFLGIAGGPGGCSRSQGAYGGAEDARKMQELSQMFVSRNRGVFFDLCDGNLGDGLAQAIEVIEDACDEFEPEDPDCVIDVDTGLCEHDGGGGGGGGDDGGVVD
jgi:hypothetical protein